MRNINNPTHYGGKDNPLEVINVIVIASASAKYQSYDT